MADEIDDTELLRLISAGDSNAFNVLLSRHLNAVLRFAYRYLPNRTDAEDIAQETFLRVWKKSASWKPQGHTPRSWLYRIAYHLCIDELRRRPLSHSNAENIGESLELAMEQDSELEQLSLAVNALPERQRAAISLCALQGLSNREAAAAMDISVDALESLLSRGRRQLRNRLQPENVQEKRLHHTKGNPS